MMFLKSILLLHKMRCRPCFSNYIVLLVLNQLRAMQVRMYTNDFLLQMYFICFLKHCPPCTSSWLIYNILCKLCSEMPIWRIRSSVALLPVPPALSISPPIYLRTYGRAPALGAGAKCSEKPHPVSTPSCQRELPWAAIKEISKTEETNNTWS